MTHSKVFADRDGWFVTLVAHPEDARMEDWLLSEEEEDGGINRHYGLFEYALDSNDGMFYIYDPVEAEMYEPTPETWEGVDADAVESLYNAANLGLFDPVNDEYRAIQRRYLDNVDDPLGALDGRHAVGTIVRVEVGSVGYALVKVGENAWEISGDSNVYTDAEVEDEDYKVIWNA